MEKENFARVSVWLDRIASRAEKFDLRACSGNEINFQHHAPRVEFSCYRLWQILLLRNLVEIHLFDEYFAKLNLFLLH